jgi:ABC-type amino acid transport substrate-binding protein
MILAGIPIEAQGQTLSSRTLIVGTREVPPFAMKNSEGTWTGVSIDLWRQIAAALNLPFEFQERDLQGLLDGVADGSLDVAVAALSITAEHEQICDFSHPYYVTGLGIAIAPRHKTPWLVVLKRLFTLYYLKIVVGLCVLLLAIEALIFDAPILRYLIHHELKGGLEVLPHTFHREDYGIVLPKGSSLREPINRVLLAKIHGPEWQDLLHQYLGRSFDLNTPPMPQ